MQAKRSVRNCAIGGGIIMVFYFLVHRGLDWGSATETLVHFANAFSIAGMLLILFSGLCWLLKHHMLDWVLYALYQARFLLLKHKDNSYTNFYDYRTQKGEEYERMLIWPRFWTGAFFLAFGALLSLMFVLRG